MIVAASIESVLLVIILLLFMWKNRQYREAVGAAQDARMDATEIGRIRLVVEAHPDPHTMERVADIDFEAIRYQLTWGGCGDEGIELFRTITGTAVRVFDPPRGLYVRAGRV